jgi:hypothetical protein
MSKKTFKEFYTRKIVDMSILYQETKMGIWQRQEQRDDLCIIQISYNYPNAEKLAKGICDVLNDGIIKIDGEEDHI